MQVSNIFQLSLVPGDWLFGPNMSKGRKDTVKWCRARWLRV